MNESKQELLSRLAIPPERKTGRRSGPVGWLAAVAALIGIGIVVFAATARKEREPIPTRPGAAAAAAGAVAEAEPATGVVLTVSGYVIPRERIEISPRFQGTVKWIGVKKGDTVTAGDVLVRLEDDEQRARVLEAEGRLEWAEANLRNAEVNHERQQKLTSTQMDSLQALDNARRALETARAEVTMARGQLDLARTWLEWCTIRAPISGTILEKLVNANELVVPTSYGGGRGPSTAFLAMADLQDLQVEIDLNEADTPKVRLEQPCRISPEAYPDQVYQGYVAEIAPEANRSKGTLQVKVQVRAPDAYLTPELTAKVEFLAE
jgi:HlyD family secretion protein